MMTVRGFVRRALAAPVLVPLPALPLRFIERDPLADVLRRLLARRGVIRPGTA